MSAAKECSAYERHADGSRGCKHGHVGPGMQACLGIRYPDGKALAPCEREDLPFDEERRCIRVDGAALAQYGFKVKES